MKWRSTAQSLIHYLFIAFLLHAKQRSTPLQGTATNRKITWCFAVHGLEFIPQCGGVMELLLDMGPRNKCSGPCAGINVVLCGLLLVSIRFLKEVKLESPIFWSFLSHCMNILLVCFMHFHKMPSAMVFCSSKICTSDQAVARTFWP